MHRLIDRVKPWLESVKPAGTFEVRFHEVHLLDSLLEIRMRRIAWDLNFGEGTHERQIFYIDGQSPLGRNLTTGRYGMIWERSTMVLRYSAGNVETDLLSGTYSADGGELLRQVPPASCLNWTPMGKKPYFTRLLSSIMAAIRTWV